MSTVFSSERFVCIRDDVRRIAARASVQEEHLARVVRTAESDVRDAETALMHARDGDEQNGAELRRACSARLRQTVARAEAARHACVTAREQAVAAARLLSRLDDDL